MSLFSTYVSSTCFGTHRSIIRSVLYKLYLQIWYVVIRVLLDTSSWYEVVVCNKHARIDYQDRISSASLWADGTQGVLQQVGKNKKNWSFKERYSRTYGLDTFVMVMVVMMMMMMMICDHFEG